MKNITTLSLITATILLINGCGEQSSPKTTTQVDNPIEQLAQASKTHSKSDWDKINSEIKSLAHKDIFMILMPTSIKANVDNLTYVGIDKDKAYAINADIMFDKLNELDLADLDNQIVAECHDDTTCQETAYKSLESALSIDKKKAYAIAMDIHKDNPQTTMEKLLTDFTCEAGLVKTVQWYGVDDNFSTANGDEIAHPSAQLQSIPSIINYNNGIGLSNYDTPEINRQFGEEVKNLPINITKGHFYIGMKNQGDNDKISIGNIDNNSTTQDIFSETISMNNAGLSRDGEVYHSDFSNINFIDGTNLQSYANAQSRFDVYVQDDTSVDFIAVATCSKPDPIKEIEEIVNKFECTEKEGTLVQVVGGTKDAFSSTSDQAVVVSNDFLTRSNPYATTGYDATQYDKNLLDTLSLPSGTITKAEFAVGYKPLNSSLHTNDTVHIGKYGVEHAGGRYILYPSTTNPNASEPYWVPYTISNGEIIRKVNLANITTTNTNVNMLNWIQGKTDFEVRIEDDTAVDFTQLNLCVKEGCKEEVSLDLSQLANWTVKPSDAIENNVFNGTQYQGVWDDTLNWFQFDSSKSDEMLKIPFCACGDTKVNINHFKADNNATIQLDNTLVASQQGADQLAMIRDDMTKNGQPGNHVSGSASINGTGTGVNHVLRLNVHNFGSYFGVAIDGKLTFHGTLGECQE